MRVLFAAIFAVTLLSCSQDAITSASDEMANSSLKERMLNDPVIAEGINTYYDWQALQSEGVQQASRVLTEMEYGAMRENPSLAFQYYSDAGYANATKISETYIQYVNAGNEMLTRYQDELMALPVGERQEISSVLETTLKK